MKEINETELSRSEKAALLLKNNKKYLVAAAVALVLILGVVGVIDYIGGQKAEDSMLMAEDINDSVLEYLRAADDDKAGLKEELLALVEQGKQDYQGLYAHMAALNAEAQMNAEDENWTDAAMAYTALAEAFPEAYNASIFLLNAAAMHEEADNLDAAVSTLEKLVSEYAAISPDVPEALFNLGRISETRGDAAKASEYYEKISSDFSSSNWTNLAKSRIIALKAGS